MSVGRMEWARASEPGVGLREVELARGLGFSIDWEREARKGR